MSLVFLLSDFFSGEDAVGKKAIPVVLLIIYSFAGAGIYYAIEEGGYLVKSYWEALWFVNTVITTIGYGNIFPLTVGGKIFTCLYALVGIPLTLTAFNNIGELMCRPFNYLWNLCKRRRKAHKSASNDPDSDSLPVSLGLLLTVIWIFLSALYFYLVSANTDTVWYPSSNWYFGDALYFVIISVTTVGFGDFFPTNYQLTVPHFTFIIGGLSLFSMVVNLLEQQLDNFIRFIKRRMFEIYKEALLADREIGVTDVKVLMKKMKGGRFLLPFLSKNTKEELQDELNLYAGRRTKGTQTGKLMVDERIQTENGIRPSVYQLTQTVKTYRPDNDWM